jgi:drug/metabolite transporter (DMT)-like permease
LLEPLTATLLAVGLRDERLTAAGVVGAALIAGALLLHYLAPRERTGQTASPAWSDTLQDRGAGGS